jgi:putative spermidine/putrescine transport system permease protein
MRRRVDLGTVSLNLTLGVLALLCLALLILPTAVVILVSFTSGFSLRFPPPGYSLRWYVGLLDAWQLQLAALNSFKVATWTTFLSVLLGVAAALGIARSRLLAANLLDSLFMSPLILPGLAFGLSALIFFSMIGWQVSVLTLVIGHTIVCVPFVLRTTIATLVQLDPVLLESSASLGASRWYTFRRVILPLIGSGILAGAFLAFMSSFDNIPVSLFLRNASTEMLPIRMWQDLESLLDVRIAAVSGVLVFTTLVLMIIMERIAGLSKRMQ